MNLFKRLTTSVTASVDKFVRDVENHDAVIESMLQELNQAATQCRIRLRNFNREGTKLENELKETRLNESKWTTRAQELADKLNETSEQTATQEKALACLERRRICQTKINRLEQQLAEHRAVEQKTLEQLQTIEEKQSDINHKRHALKSQQALAEANKIVASISSSSSNDLDSALERWEIAIARKEVSDVYPASTGGTSMVDHSFDQLEREYQELEADQELLTELEQMSK